MGRGTQTARIGGNVNFRKVCWKIKAQYLFAKRDEKREIAKQVINEIASLNPPGRFLEEVGEEQYVLVDQSRAIEKTCQQLREKKVRKPAGMSPIKPLSSARPKKAPFRQQGKQRRTQSIGYGNSDDDSDYTETPVIVKSKASKTVAKKKKAAGHRKPTVPRKPSVPKEAPKEPPKKARKAIEKRLSLGSRRSMRLAINQSILEDRYIPEAGTTKAPKAKAEPENTELKVLTPVKEPPVSTKKDASLKEIPAAFKEPPVLSPIPMVMSPPPRAKYPLPRGHYSAISDTDIPPTPAEPPFPLPPLQSTTSSTYMPEFLRGFSSMSFRAGTGAAARDAFEAGLEGIAEPPPLAAFSSGFSFGSLSACKTTDTMATTMNTPPRGKTMSSRGGGGVLLGGAASEDLVPPSPTQLQPYNSLFIEGIPSPYGPMSPNMFTK